MTHKVDVIPKSSRLATWCAFCLLVSAACALADDNNTLDLSAIERIEVEPGRIELHDARDVAHVLVTGHFRDGRVVDLTREAKITPIHATVAENQGAKFVARGDGACEFRVEIGPQHTTLPVVVSAFDERAPISFHSETVAALTRQGCNSGACHGSPSGKGGFPLSLQAYDHSLDESSLIRAEQGRRINCVEPEQSLLLLKPTMTVAHRGGLQLQTTDYAYDVLRQWIAEGARVDARARQRCVRLELLPASGRVLTFPRVEQQIVARAHFEDGAVRDVTRLTKFSSSDDAIATVSADGLLVGQRRGQVAVMARYLDQLVSTQFTLVEDVPDFKWPDPPANNYIDTHFYEKLKQLQYEPSALCTDNEFVRRAYLDVIGLLPTITEQDAFLNDKQPDRRQRLIDDLLNRPEYARLWALKWGDLLRLQKNRLKEAGVFKFYQWLVDSFAANKPFDQFARELLTAEGSTYEHPAANYYRACADPVEAAETTAQLFLGSRIQCAKCHNHPFENWTQDNFYGLTAFFNRVSRKPGLRDAEEIVFVGRSGEVQQPRTGQTMKPWLPEKGAIDTDGLADRRRAFADWLTSAENPFFARVAANRIWAEVMGQGIVDPVDDFRQSNPPANAALLDELAKDFVQHGFDQRYLLRTILNSRAYQLSSQPNKSNADDTRLFSHAKTRMLSAEPLLDAICQVTQVNESFVGLPQGTRAGEVPSPDFGHEFLDTFGRPVRATACECERGTASTLAQAIDLFNGPLIHKKLADPNNRFHRELAAGRPHARIIEDLYRSAVCRLPTDREMHAALSYLVPEQTASDGLEDICWALFNTEEFLTQH